MNIGIVIPQLNSYGGAEIYLLECLKRWQKHAEIVVYTPSFQKRLFKEFGIDSNVKVINLHLPRTSNKRFGLFEEVLVMPRIWEQQIQKHDLYFLYLFPTHMIQRRPSIWFAAEPMRMLYDLRHYSNDKDVEVAVHCYPKHYYDHMRVSDLEIMQQIIEKVDSGATFDKLVTISRTVGRYIKNIYGRNPDRVVYPGIHLPDDISPPPTFDKVLYVGRLWNHKRVGLIIKAMALTMSSNKLIIVGDGPEKNRLRKLARKLGITDSVHFIGDVSMEERDRLYRECTCCVYTPVREPFGMVPLEAAAAGRPVVATAGGGYSEILTGDAALFVPAYEGAIADGIHSLMSNPDRAMEMGRAGRKIAESYTWDRTADSLMDVFRETLRGPVGRRYGKREKPSGTSRTLLGAHYYPWYRAGKNILHWNENTEFSGVTDFPVGGSYSSHHRSVIKRHLRLAKRAGIDFFIVNLQVDFRGLNPEEAVATEKIFEVVEEEGHQIKLAILLAFYTEDQEIIKSTIRCVKKDFLSRPCYQRYKRKPVLWYFLNEPFQGLLFHEYGELTRLHQGIHPVATGAFAYTKFLPRLLCQFFSGWCFYSPLQVGPKNNWEEIWRESYRDFIEDDGEVRVFTICPGWDDSHLTSDSRSSKHRCISRMGLRTYKRMQKAALDLNPGPDYVVITSFNEFHENTHIEPSENFGDMYLRSTLAFKEKIVWK